MTEQAVVAINFPGAAVVDVKTVRIRARSFLEAYVTFRALAGFTGLATPRVLLDACAARPVAPTSDRRRSRACPDQPDPP